MTRVRDRVQPSKKHTHQPEDFMSIPRSPTQAERLAVLEQRVSHIETQVMRMSAQIGEMHAVLMQARGVRWAVIAVAGIVGFLTGLAHWFIPRT